MITLVVLVGCTAGYVVLSHIKAWRAATRKHYLQGLRARLERR